ncbi:hypothetical protein [Streptomyces sp. NPDC056544]|uniref:hypothetical protein n=1 Tax=unclassified Streptomyces TaxID=2593676 RepID=UPI0036832B14
MTTSQHPIDADLAQRRLDAEAVRRSALDRARAERAGLARLSVRVQTAPHPLEQTG